MSNNVNEVVAGTPLLGGAVFRGPLGSPIPTDESVALNAALKDLGYASDAGLTEAIERSVEKKNDWGGRLIKTIQTEVSATFTVTLVQALNADVAKARYGNNAVTVTPATSSAGNKLAVAFKGEPLERGVWVFEMKDGPARTRVVLPDAQVTETGEVEYSTAELVGFESTIECFPDENGNYFYKYTDDGIKDTGE